MTSKQTVSQSNPLPHVMPREGCALVNRHSQRQKLPGGFQVTVLGGDVEKGSTNERSKRADHGGLVPQQGWIPTSGVSKWPYSRNDVRCLSATVPRP